MRAQSLAFVVAISMLATNGGCSANCAAASADDTNGPQPTKRVDDKKTVDDKKAVDGAAQKYVPTADIAEGARALQLPSFGGDVKLVGKPVARALYTDKSGEHVVVVTETELRTTPAKSDLDDETETKEIFAHHFTRAHGVKGKNEPWRHVWHTKDWVKDCPFDVVVEFVNGSLEITDLNGDERFESTFAYRLTCTSDVSPLTLKLLMHDGEKKLAVRGSNIVDLGIDEGTGKPVRIGGDFKLDDAFKTAPKEFATHATMRFQQFAVAD